MLAHILATAMGKLHLGAWHEFDEDGGLYPHQSLIKIKAGVLYTQTEIRMALKGILFKGKLILIRLKDSFLLHLNWGCTNTRSGIKHRLGGQCSLYYVQNLLISR